MLTMADFPGTITLRALIQGHCGCDENKLWDLYFEGGMDEEVRHAYEMMLQPGVRTTAVMLRAFLRQMRKSQ